MEHWHQIGIVGSGFIAKGFMMALDQHPDLVASKVLTRTDVHNRRDFVRQDLLTNSIDELLDNSDLIVECSGDVIHATEVISRAMERGLPVVTMNADFQVTTGSYFVRKGLITEAEGDQPGCLAALREDLLAMGFKPLVYGNIKGFLNRSPSEDEMRFWAKKQNLSLQMTTSFTDGTKVQIEQALVANGLGADIVVPGLLGIPSEDVRTGALALAERARALDRPISDYILSPNSPPGVFIVAEHDQRQKGYLSNFKLGEGPYYVLLRNYHLCHLEIAKTVRRVLNGHRPLLDNSEHPTISIAAIAKRPLVAGQTIKRGIGSFDVRGSAVRIADSPEHLPIGLVSNAVVTTEIEAGQQLSLNDVELPDSLALQAWREIQRSATRHVASPRPHDGEELP